MTDPATMREAARQAREEADRITLDDSMDTAPALQAVATLQSLARRFDNEAKAAEKAEKKP